MEKLCGERGIIFNDPGGEIPATTNQTRSAGIFVLPRFFQKASFLRSFGKTKSLRRLAEGLICQCGERGIIFNDPAGENLASQITSLFVSLIRLFNSYLSSFSQA